MILLQFLFNLLGAFLGSILGLIGLHIISSDETTLMGVIKEAIPYALAIAIVSMFLL